MVDLLDDPDLLDIKKRGSKTDPAQVTKEIRSKFTQQDTSNDELRKWEQESKKTSAPTKTAKADGTRLCTECQKWVPGRDYWVMLGLCSNCAGNPRGSQFDENNWLDD